MFPHRNCIVWTVLFCTTIKWYVHTCKYALLNVYMHVYFIICITRKVANDLELVCRRCCSSQMGPNFILYTFMIEISPKFLLPLFIK